MAVYFAPQRKNTFTTMGIVDLLGKYLLSPAMERSAEARKVKQGREDALNQRAYTEDQNRLAAETKAANDATNEQRFLENYTKIPEGGAYSESLGNTLLAAQKLGLDPKKIEQYVFGNNYSRDTGKTIVDYNRAPGDVADRSFVKQSTYYEDDKIANEKTDLAQKLIGIQGKIASDNVNAQAHVRTANAANVDFLGTYNEDGSPQLYDKKTGALVRTPKGTTAPGKGKGSGQVHKTNFSTFLNVEDIRLKKSLGIDPAEGGLARATRDQKAKYDEAYPILFNRIAESTGFKSEIPTPPLTLDQVTPPKEYPQRIPEGDGVFDALQRKSKFKTVPVKRPSWAVGEVTMQQVIDGAKANNLSIEDAVKDAEQTQKLFIVDKDKYTSE